jgi:Mn2+/Fe2+ NRAMP family transporter
LTAVDVLIVLAFFQRPDKGRKGMMAFELLIVCLVSARGVSSGGTVGCRADSLARQVLCVFICFVILLVQIKPVWKDVFDGFIPSSVSRRRCPVGVVGPVVVD